MLSLLIAISLLLIASVEARTLVADPGGYGDSKTLAGAVSKAQPGDEILLKSGSYEGAVLNRRLSISGQEGARIISKATSALIVTAPGCKISNLSIQASGSAPALVLQSSDNLLVGCSVQGAQAGISISGGNNTILKSDIRSKLGAEVKSEGSRLLNSTFQGDLGIRIRNSSNNDISGCKILTISGVEVQFSSQNRIENNSLSGMGIGMALSRSEDNQVSGNSLSGQYVSGLDILNSSNNTLSSNLIQGGKLGISLRGSDNNSVAKNICKNNERAGIYTDGSSGNQIEENELSGNGNGILLANSGGNWLFANRAFLNTYGISLRGALKNSLRNNSLQSNLYNLRIDNGEESSAALAESGREFFLQDIDQTNLVEGKPVCYMVGAKDLAVPEGCGFIALVDCRNVSVVNQTVYNSSTGILMVGSSACQVKNSSFYRSESGVYLLDCKLCEVNGCRAEGCKNGFHSLASSEGRFEKDASINCSESGFRAEDSLSLIFTSSSAQQCLKGISLMNSRLCQVLNCSASRNKEAGINLIGSHKCFLGGNEVSQNDRGLVLSGSNACILSKNKVEANRQDGFFLEQLSSAELTENYAFGNDQGLFLHSSKRVLIERNNLSQNSKYGLRMSAATECNITDNNFFGNSVSGVNLVDSSGNSLYHNIFENNGLQNAVDNGENRWDGGPTVGGNYWSDHKVEGNPGKDPRMIPSGGVDRYPFQSPGGWR